MPGKTRTPTGRTSSIASLRLNGAALPCLVQSGLKAICGLRLSAHLAAMSSAPLGLPPCSSTMPGCLVSGPDRASSPDQAVIVEIENGEGNLLGREAGAPSALGAALHGEEIAAVDHRGGEVAMVDHRAGAGRQIEWVLRSKRSAAWSRISSKALRRSRRVWPLCRQAFEFVVTDLRAILFALEARCDLVVVEFVRSGRWRDGRG